MFGYVRKKDNELEDAKRHYDEVASELRMNYDRMEQDLKVKHAEELLEKEGEIQEGEIGLNKKQSEIDNLKEQLKMEQDNRQVLIDAAVQNQLGQYETKYFHDLHTGLEKRADDMQKFQESTLDRVLKTLEAMKPAEPKTLILGKEVFGVDAKAGGGGGKQEKQN